VRVTRPAGATLDLNFMSAPLETVMRVLSEAPYRVVAPLIGEIQAQCMRQQADPNIKAATEA
jgi:ubiquinone/menaquinone biosynthesis C-methylase UbiE